jgi:hypothetical protein
MLDDIRKTASEPSQQENAPQPENKQPLQGDGKKFLGMTAKQRFILALLLLVSVCVLGSLCLVVFGKVYFP